MPDFVAARSVLRRAIETHVFPGAVVEVGRAEGMLWTEAQGHLTYAENSLPAETHTLYDLASLTKVIATTTLAMRLVDDCRLRLTDQLAGILPAWSGRDRAAVTVRHLLAHSSGLPAWLPLYKAHSGRQAFQTAICTLPLDHPPGTAAVYSDLGFILLGFLLEDAGGAPLNVLFDRLWAGLDLASPSVSPGRSESSLEPPPLHIGFSPPAGWRRCIAPTEIDPWRSRLLVGEAHDENCWALGGVAGHAGLFGTTAGVGAFARLVLAARLGREGPLARPETVMGFCTRQTEPGSSRALGWDTMLPTSSCGTRMSGAAFGHTGFTGTSLWIDPDADLYVVLLANRVHPSRKGNGIDQVRPALHDAIMQELQLVRPSQARGPRPAGAS